MSKVIEYLSDYKDEAQKRKATFGKTDKYKTGFPGLDRYLGDGYGNRHGYEIITVFGETGVGKSMFALNMVGHEMAAGTKVGLLVLEDDMPDVYNRVEQIVGIAGMDSIEAARNVDVFPAESLEKPWTFGDILKWLQDKREERGIELFLVDHINFIFDNATLATGSKELSEQRLFMRNLNFLCRKLKLTVILVSHTSKGDQEGMAKVYGTTAITQVSTKVIGVKMGEGADFIISLYKSRFTRRDDNIHQMRRAGMRLEEYVIPPYVDPKKGKKK